jgi:hypothetical protein
VRVDLERDVGVGVSELAADEGDVQPVRDQERGVAVSQRVEREPPVFAGDACAFEGGAEVFADVAVVEAAADRVAEDEVMARLEPGGEPALAQEGYDRRGKDDLAPGRPMLVPAPDAANSRGWAGDLLRGRHGL